MRAQANRQEKYGVVEGVPNDSRFAITPSRRLVRLSRLAAVIFCCAALMSGQNIISTVAGGGTLPPFSTSALGSYADLAGPASIVTDKNGNVYVASPDANQIYEISAGTMSVFAGQGWPIERPTVGNAGKLATQANLNAPYGLAIDGAGNIYIADTGAYVVWQVGSMSGPNPGVISVVAGFGDGGGGGDCGIATNARLTYPYAVATDISGNVYIADSADQRIRMVNMQTTAIHTSECGTLQPGYIATVAGNGTQCMSPTSPCGDGGNALAAQLNYPQGVFVDALGNILIADSGDHRVRVVPTTGNIYAYAGNGMTCTTGACGDGGAASTAELGNPWQIYVDSGENLYIADSLQQRIRKVAPGTPATISTFAGNGGSCSGKNTPPAVAAFCGDGSSATAAYLNRPQGVYGDTFGNIYVGDTANQRVRQVASGNINTYAGGGLSDGPALSAILASNLDVAVDGTGNLYIADTGNNRIRKVSGGTISTLAGSGVANYYGNDNTPAINANLSQPHGLALDSLGNVYIADTYNYVIRVLNTQNTKISVAGVAINVGEVATVAGTPAVACSSGTCGDGGQARSAKLAWPTGVALDGAGNIYIVDETAGVVRMVNTQAGPNLGLIQTVAGQLWNFCTTPTNFPACGDTGPATSATLFKPYSVAIDSLGNIFVSDAGDNRIRWFTVGGNINAYAFDGITQFGPDGQPALSSAYIFPEYLALDSRDNLFVSGSTLYYTMQRVDSSTNPALLNPVSSVAGYGQGLSLIHI